MQKKIILTGDRPTGKLHLGHYFGSLANRIKLQNQREQYQQYIMMADMQALTDNANNSAKVVASVEDLILDYYSVGLMSLDENCPQSTVFLQSAIPALSEITMYYMNLVSEGRVLRNPTIKSEKEQKKWQNNSIPFGFLAYPISQAADITAFQADLVPVGADQLPMIELTNEIVNKFNNIYGSVLTPAQALIAENSDLSRLLGIDGKQKMSKSLNNAIFLSDSKEEIRAKINKMKTCTRHSLDMPGTLVDNTLFYFIEVVSNWLQINNIHHPLLSQIPIWKARYINGGSDLVDYAKDTFLKDKLFELIDYILAPIRSQREQGLANINLLYKKIGQGNVKANIIANNTLNKLKSALGLQYMKQWKIIS